MARTGYFYILQIWIRWKGRRSYESFIKFGISEDALSLKNRLERHARGEFRGCEGAKTVYAGILFVGVLPYPRLFENHFRYLFSGSRYETIPADLFWEVLDSIG